MLSNQADQQVRIRSPFWRESDTVPHILEEAAGICQKLKIPITEVSTDGQHSIRNAVHSALPDVPHQLCHFHYLREAAKPVADADRHAKKDMHFFLTKGLTETHALWEDVEMGYQWVHRAAHLLTNDEKQTAVQVRQNYEILLAEMEQAPTTSDAVITMLTTLRKVTASYWPGLFHCYDDADLPRTNNDLEQ
jgi:hypothetical protein